MQFPALAAALLGALSLADALHVPVGTPDGIYDVVEGDDGEPILTKIGDLVDGIIGGDEIRPRQPAGFSRIQKRADYGCYPFSLIRNDIQRAATNLGNTCGEFARVRPASSGRGC